MKWYYLLFVIVFLKRKKKDNNQADEDYRKPYTGVFNFTTIKSTVCMCYDTIPPCINGWKEYDFDTTYYSSNVSIIDSNRLVIQIGDGIIGVDDRGNDVSKTFYSILLNDSLSLPEYPLGAGYFKGHYIGYDTIILDIQFGYGIGGYHKYEILGIRE